MCVFWSSDIGLQLLSALCYRIKPVEQSEIKGNKNPLLSSIATVILLYQKHSKG